MYHYVYRITNIKEKRHYYGARSSKIKPELDIGVRYFSSSSDEKFMFEQVEQPQNFKYKVIGTFRNREEAMQLEVKLHAKFNVAQNPNFYNRQAQTSTGFDRLGARHTSIVELQTGTVKHIGLDEETPDGWYRGKTLVCKLHKDFGKIKITNGKENKIIDLYKETIPSGWVRGVTRDWSTHQGTRIFNDGEREYFLTEEEGKGLGYTLGRLPYSNKGNLQDMVIYNNGKENKYFHEKPNSQEWKRSSLEIKSAKTTQIFLVRNTQELKEQC